MKRTFTIKLLALSVLFFFALNSISAQRDTIPPVILTITSDTQFIQIGSVWFDQTTFSDNQTDEYSIIIKKTWLNGPVNSAMRGVYPITYQATDTNGNTSVKDYVYVVDDFIPSTSIQQLQFFTIDLYPNPANESLTVRWFGEPNTSIIIMSLDGKSVLESTLKSGENIFDIKTLSPGVYTVILYSENTIQNQKLIIQDR